MGNQQAIDFAPTFEKCKACIEKYEREYVGTDSKYAKLVASASLPAKQAKVVVRELEAAKTSAQSSLNTWKAERPLKGSKFRWRVIYRKERKEWKKYCAQFEDAINRLDDLKNKIFQRICVDREIKTISKLEADVKRIVNEMKRSIKPSKGQPCSLNIDDMIQRQADIREHGFEVPVADQSKSTSSKCRALKCRALSAKLEKLKAMIEKTFDIGVEYEYKFANRGKTWLHHEAAAKEWGGHLVWIENEDENAHVQTLLKGKHIFIGARRIHENRNGPGPQHWKWSNEAARFQYCNWNPGEVSPALCKRCII